MNKKLYRTEYEDKKLCGVCGGIAEYFDLDPTLVRIGWALLSLFWWFTGVIAYVVCALIIPKKSDVYPNE